MTQTMHDARMRKAVTVDKPSRRGRPPVRRPAQRAALLDAAADQINQNGAASISLADLGAGIGITRSGLYYYCVDAADLVLQCYVRSCAQLSDDIDEARKSAVSADEKLARLIRAVLAPDRPTTAVMNDVAFLPENHQADIGARWRENVLKLVEIFDEGEKTGVLRPVEAELSSRLILNCLSWALTSKPWLAQRDDTGARVRYADTLAAVLLDGLALQRDASLRCDIRLEDLFSRTINPFDRRQTAELKADQIIAAASRLFNVKGLDGVRLDDVSAAIGTTNGAIYHHFRDKTDLIERCYGRAFDMYELMMDVGVSTGTTPLERCIIVMHLNTQAQLSDTPPLSLQPGLTRLTPLKSIALARRAQTLSSTAAANLTEGIKERVLRPLDMTHIAQLLAGYFFGLPQSLQTEANSIEVANRVVDIVAYGFRNRS